MNLQESIRRILREEDKYDDKVGKTFWFEYHCYESPESCDAEIWYRSHQKVKVIGVSEWSYDDKEWRQEDGNPRVYLVEWEDGFQYDVFEDELFESPDEFYRPSPPKRKIQESIKRILRDETNIRFNYNKKNINENEINPDKNVLKNICDSEKFCSSQGKITFGQLKAIVDSATNKRLFQHVGEGGVKATMRLLPWFIPQLAIAGFTGSIVRAVNKILRPTLEETRSYKTWWGKVVMKMFDLGEGELNLSDPLSRVFFISDGLMTLMDNKYKVKFARHIAELASTMPDDKEVPEFFVENELRHWINDKFLLDPPLKQKKIE